MMEDLKGMLCLPGLLFYHWAGISHLAKEFLMFLYGSFTFGKDTGVDADRQCG